MCGIVGFITAETLKGEDDRAKFMSQGLIVDTLRGDDSTGVFAVGHDPLYKKGGAWWAKSTDSGHAFINSPDYLESMVNVVKYRAAVGHNRAATVGGVSTATAHPFQEGPITLVHNGTLTHTTGLPTPMYTIDDCDVDSHAIAHNLGKHSVQDVIKQLSGAFTLVWHDSRDDSMNMIRNSKRPMHISKSGSQDSIFFASEGPMLDFLGKRLGLSLGAIYYPKEGQWLKWLPDTQLTAPIVEELELYDAGWFNNTTYGSAYGTAYSQREDEEDWKKWYPEYAGSSISVGKPIQDDRVFVGGRKKVIPLALQEELLKYDLLVEDRLVFQPRVHRLIEVGRAQVFGMLKSKYKAVIYSCLESYVNRMNYTWTVRPIGVYVKPSGEPMIIVELVSVSMITNPKDNVTLMDEDGNELKHMGPYGVRITEEAFYAAVAAGCGMCGRPIDAKDANELLWVNNGTECLCQFCDEGARGDNYLEERAYE